MKIDFTFTYCDSGIKLRIRCEDKGEYPFANIFTADPMASVDMNAHELVKLYPVQDSGVAAEITMFPGTNINAQLWAESIEGEIREQYELWKDNKLPDNYTAEIE